MTRNPNPTATKGFGARVGAEAGGAGAPLFPWGPRLPLIHAHLSWGDTTPVEGPLSPSLPTSAHPGQGAHDPSPRTAMPWCRRVAFIFSSETKTVLSGDQSLIAAFPSVCRVQQSLAKEFLCLGHVQGRPLCVLLGLING